MTLEELKQHCARQITDFERIKEIMPVTQNDYKRYEEHKIVLQLIEALDKIKAELHATSEMHEDGNYYLHEEWIDEIIDKYREVRE